MSSSCFRKDEALYGYEEDQENKMEEKAPIEDNESEDEPVLNLNTQGASLPPQNNRGKQLPSIANLRPKRSASFPQQRGKQLQKIAGIYAGTVCSVQKTTGCRYESDQTIPETLPESVSFSFEVSSKKWNCLLGNAIHTIEA
jgi:hypothetical protein